MLKDYRFWALLIGALIIGIALDTMVNAVTGLSGFILFTSLVLVATGGVIEYVTGTIAPQFRMLPWVKAKQDDDIAVAERESEILAKARAREQLAKDHPKPWRLVVAADGIPDPLALTKVIHQKGGVSISTANDIFGKLTVSLRDEPTRQAGIVTQLQPANESILIRRMAELNVSARPEGTIGG